MKFLKSTLPALLLFPLAVLANSDQQKINDRLNDQRTQMESRPKFTPKIEQRKAEVPSETKGNTVSISQEELVNHPDLVIRALLPAVFSSNIDNVALLYPIYQKLPQNFHDPILSKWAEAIVAKKARKYRNAIQLYRQIVAEHPEILEARFQLALALFENNELEAAEDQFKKLRSERLADPVLKVIDQYIEAINQADRWTFGGGFTYLYDPNINNAPKSGTKYGGWTPAKAESAQGVGANIELSKKWSWGNGFYNEMRLSSNGKYYWNNKKYNEIQLRGSLGIGFQNAHYNLAILPFMEQSLYAGGSAKSETLKRFSKTGGVSTELSYWISPKWQVNANYEYGEQRYITRKHLNGNSHFISSGMNFYTGAKQIWFGNVSYNRLSVRARDDSYYRKGISLGWHQEWGKGLTTRISLNAARRQYKGNMIIFGIVQRNREYGLQASVWHRAVSFWDITPRLTYHYNKTQSNHPFYSYDKHKAFIELSRQF